MLGRVTWSRRAALVLVVGGLALIATACRDTDIPQELVDEGNRGVALMGRFEYDAARTVFADLAERYPGNADVLVNLAIATLNRQAEGDDEEAVAILTRALDLDPSNLRASYCRGILTLSAGEAVAALADFRAVAEGDPEDADAWYFVGQCLMQLERPEEAFVAYQRAMDLDPYLRSAYYQAFQALQRSGRRDEAMVLLEEFRRLEHNPRARLIEIKYTRMGRRGEALPFGTRSTPPGPPPTGPLFAEEIGLDLAAGRWRESVAPGEIRPSITVCDINADGALDLFFAAAVGRGDDLGNVVAFGRAQGGFEAVPDHPLAEVGNVNAALWGDLDSDGLTDVYLCRRGPNQLWRGTGDGGFEDTTEASATSGGETDTVDGALIDADHDGDLDVFLVNVDGPNELLNNDRDGGFRPLAAERGLDVGGTGSRGAVFADLDNDRDADIIVVSKSGANEVLINDLIWSYHPAEEWHAFAEAEVEAAVAGDLDSDGTTELYTVGGGDLTRWETGTDDLLAGRIVASLGQGGAEGNSRLALADVDGDGVVEVIAQRGGKLVVVRAETGDVVPIAMSAPAAWTLAVLEASHGPSIVTWSPTAGASLLAPGPGRFGFAALEFAGREDRSAELRSNASGIGCEVAVRIGPSWTVSSTFRRDSGPGQSLQPMSVGLGGAPDIDFVAVDWSDGVFQTEMDLAAGELHSLVETQRQLSSCPVLFVWDGRRFAFVSDLLGVGGIGYAVGPDTYAEPRPWENLLLPEGMAAARDGRFILKIGEPMEEAAYLDAVRLLSYDLPPGWSMVPDDRMGIAGPAPSGRPLYFRHGLQPVEVVNERGEDVTATIREVDLQAAPVGELDRRFIGMLAGEHVLELRFDQYLDRLGANLALMVDGWIEYPYSQTTFAAWQADAAYEAPTLEARGRDGRWRTVLEQWGYPAGMPRRAAVPLPPLPAGTTELRLRTNQEIYWDRLEIVVVEPCPEAVRTELPLVEARLAQTGFAARTTGPQRQPRYDYDHRAPVWDTRSQEGWYTRLGEVRPLLVAAEGATAIIGPGEEVQLEFASPATLPKPGWKRLLVVESEGWCKDMDLYTADGATLEPLPGSDRGGRERAELIEAYNTRFRQGRD